MPLFVICFLLVLVADLGLISYILDSPDEVTFMMVLMLLIMGVPLVGLFAGPAALEWKRAHLCEAGQAAPPLSSALAPLSCASSLVFLVFTSLLSLAPQYPDQPKLVLVVWIYLIIQVIRMQQGMFGNLLISLYLLVRPKRPSERVYGLATLLGGLAGLSLVATYTTGWLGCWLHQDGTPPPNVVSQWLALLLLVWISFAYGLMWGGSLLWLAGRSPNREQSPPA